MKGYEKGLPFIRLVNKEKERTILLPRNSIDGVCMICNKQGMCEAFSYQYGKQAEGTSNETVLLQATGEICLSCQRKQLRKSCLIHLSFTILCLFLLIMVLLVFHNPSVRYLSFTLQFIFLFAFFFMVISLFFSFKEMISGRVTNEMGVHMIQQKIHPLLRDQGFPLFINPNQRDRTK